jgi:hypothetical protein
MSGEMSRVNPAESAVARRRPRNRAKPIAERRYQATIA